jgi:hypothetical protein
MEFNVEKSIALQKKLCETRGLPHFAPRNGRCFKCFEQNYEQKERTGWNGRKYNTGISTESAGTTLVTGCPHCNKSFCD